MWAGRWSDTAMAGRRGVGEIPAAVRDSILMD